MPEAQAEQDTEPEVSLNFPASQSWHVAAADSLLYLPVMQSEQDAEAVPLNWPAPQSLQAEDSTPVAALVRYFPAGQLQME